MTAVDDRTTSGPASGSAEHMTITLKVCDELDIAEVHHLREQLMDALAVHPRAIVVDLSACPFLDAQALMPLLDAHRGARRMQVDFALRGLKPQARRLLALAGVQDVFTVLEDA